MAKSHREGRELEDTGQKRSLQKDNTLGPKAPLETPDRRPSRKLAPESSVEDPRKDQSQRPPLWNHLRLQKLTDREGKRHRTQVRTQTEITTKNCTSKNKERNG